MRSRSHEAHFIVSSSMRSFEPAKIVLSTWNVQSFVETSSAFKKVSAESELLKLTSLDQRAQPQSTPTPSPCP